MYVSISLLVAVVKYFDKITSGRKSFLWLSGQGMTVYHDEETKAAAVMPTMRRRVQNAQLSSLPCSLIPARAWRPQWVRGHSSYSA